MSVFLSATIISHSFPGYRQHRPKWNKTKESQAPQNKKGKQCTPAEKEQLWQSIEGNKVPTGGVLWVSFLSSLTLVALQSTADAGASRYICSAAALSSSSPCLMFSMYLFLTMATITDCFLGWLNTSLFCETDIDTKMGPHTRSCDLAFSASVI